MADSRKRRFLNNIDESSVNKKFETGVVSGFRFLIPSKAAGAMIGKGGEVIKRLRSEYNCRIIVPDSQGPERLVIIDASPNIVLNVWNGVLPSIKEYMNAKECDFKGSSSKYIDSDDDIDLRLIVHESQAGAVIGKGGERIRNLIDVHAMTLIKLYKVFCPQSTDRVVRMVASLDNLIGCLENVFELLENQSIKGVRKDYNPDNFDEISAPNYGGYISNDSKFPARRNNSNIMGVGFAQEGFYETEEFVPRPNIYPPVGNNYDYNMQPRLPMFRQRSHQMDHRMNDIVGGTIRLNAVNDPNAVHVSRMAVPKNLVPAIVGIDGRYICNFEQECGASVEIEMGAMDCDDCFFIISGSADQIYKAQCFMQLCARKFTE